MQLDSPVRQAVRSRYRLVAGAALLLLATGIFHDYRQGIHYLWGQNPKFGLAEMVSFTAYRPFVFRVLVPALIRLAGLVLPLPAQSLALGIMYVSLLAFVIVFRRLYAAFWPPSLLMDLASATSLIGLPFLLRHHKQLYDFTTLFLFTLALALLAEKRHRAYLILFPIACLNRETTALLIPVFALRAYSTVDRKTYIRGLVLQIVCFLAIRLSLTWLFRDNPGAAVEIHWPDFLVAARSDPGYFVGLGLFGLVVIALTLWGWTEKPDLLRKAAMVVVPVEGLAYFVIGVPHEMRFFIEAYPIVLLLVYPSLCRLVGSRLPPARP